MAPCAYGHKFGIISVKCTKDGFEMTGKPIDNGTIIKWTCPFGHTKIEWGSRPSATHAPRIRVEGVEATYPDNLERKA